MTAATNIRGMAATVWNETGSSLREQFHRPQSHISSIQLAATPDFAPVGSRTPGNLSSAKERQPGRRLPEQPRLRCACLGRETGQDSPDAGRIHAPRGE